MWTPWAQWEAWSRRTQDAAVENARVGRPSSAAGRCVERIEIELYVADLTSKRKGPDSLTA